MRGLRQRVLGNGPCLPDRPGRPGRPPWLSACVAGDLGLVSSITTADRGTLLDSWSSQDSRWTAPLPGWPPDGPL